MNADNVGDIKILRDIVKRYMEIASQPVQEMRRKMWAAHNSLERRGVPVIFSFGMWNKWCRDFFGDDKMECADPFYRSYERMFRMKLFHWEAGDDTIFEPWISISATFKRGWGNLWGVNETVEHSDMDGGAWKYDPPIKEWSDVKKLSHPPHFIDEEDTKRNLEKLGGAIGDIIPIDVNRGPECNGFLADISTCIAKLRGLEQLMIDMYESPEELHKLLAFMRDGILKNQEDTEKAGDISLSSQHNQAMAYAKGLEGPKPNSGPRKRGELWYFCAAQEFTLISPEMHYEFLLQYQLPIIRKFALSHYGCCEDLTNKIDMLRKIPNLRIIAVTPLANLAKCVEQIRRDYVISWRPNPTDMVCGSFDKSKIRRIIRNGLDSAKDSVMHIHLKDVETVEDEPSRLKEWVKIVKGEIG